MKSKIEMKSYRQNSKPNLASKPTNGMEANVKERMVTAHVTRSYKREETCEP